MFFWFFAHFEQLDFHKSIKQVQGYGPINVSISSDTSDPFPSQAFTLLTL